MIVLLEFDIYVGLIKPALTKCLGKKTAIIAKSAWTEKANVGNIKVGNFQVTQPLEAEFTSIILDFGTQPVGRTALATEIDHGFTRADIMSGNNIFADDRGFVACSEGIVWFSIASMQKIS